jgi:glycosyltransferase involved in cell wall biosynthesis
MELNVAIGPVPYVSGTKTHILNIVKYSKQKFNLIEYSPLSFYYPLYRGSGFLLRHKIPFIDPYGYYIAKKILPRYDVVHTHGHPYWWDLYKKPKRSKAKYIHTVHQIYFKEDYDEKMWSWLDILNERQVQYCKQADIVISVSKWLQQELKERGVDSVFIPNGVDIEECKNANASLFMEKYNVREDFFLFVGSMSKLKGAFLFFDLANKMSDNLFAMIGTGTTNAELNRGGIKRPKNIIGLGRLPHQEVLNAIAACRVFIHPSSKESFSSVILEGMALGKPVVATNSTGMEECVINNKEGYLFEKDNLDELYKKACKAWNNPKIGLNGYKKVEGNYDWKNLAKKIDALYGKLAK